MKLRESLLKKQGPKKNLLLNKIIFGKNVLWFKFIQSSYFNLVISISSSMPLCTHQYSITVTQMCIHCLVHHQEVTLLSEQLLNVTVKQKKQAAIWGRTKSANYYKHQIKLVNSLSKHFLGDCLVHQSLHLTTKFHIALKYRDWYRCISYVSNW